MRVVVLTQVLAELSAQGYTCVLPGPVQLR